MVVFIPSGKHTKNYGKTPCFIGKIHYNWCFSIVMLNFQRVTFLIGGLEHLLFSPIVGMMIQSDELIFFRGVGIPPIRFYKYKKKTSAENN